MPTTVRLPVDMTNPQISANAGNAWFDVIGLTAHDAGVWAMDKDTESNIYGTVNIPTNVGGTPNAKIILIICANDTNGTKADLQVSTGAIAEAESFNPASLTAETAQAFVMPTTAYELDEVSFTLTAAPVADDILIVKVFRDGDDATNDTLDATLYVVKVLLEIDVA